MPAAFHEVRLPTVISSGATGGPGFHTTVLMLASGFERRNQDWVKARATYDIAPGIKSNADMNALLKFFYARRGKLYGFRFKDFGDFKLPFWRLTPGDTDALPTLFTTDGVTAAFQITKVYGDTAASYTRTISKPVNGTVALFDNGSPLTDATLDYTTGVVTLGATPTATTGHLITGYMEFDVPVRFDIDDMRVSVTTETLHDWQSVPLVEVRI